MTYEFRGASLVDAVQQAVARNAPAIELKKLNKAPHKFDFAARARLGSALFVGEGNFSFALALARLKGGRLHLFLPLHTRMKLIWAIPLVTTPRNC
ncbi:hypothetical protein [Falsiruegeria litorea]|uniref:hypothetical protein n=1 Tax=Falsiruegeria litorea TaxID=1280831 RepID=UPI001056996C|nr:hypothetical protein [Falsiruegeria litorea]